MNEIKHLGFKYHWPKSEFLLGRNDTNVSNWWINFESKMIYIKATSKIYAFTIIERDNKVLIVFDDASSVERRLPDEAAEAYSDYIAEKTLLE